MELTKREKTIKYAIYCGLLAIFALIQNVSGLWIEIGGARCFFLIPVAVLLGIDEDEKMAAVIGAFAGILWDVVSLQHFGFNAIFIMLVCYFVSALVSFLLRATYWVGVVSSVVASLLYVVIYWLLFVAIKGGDGVTRVFFTFYVPSFICTSIMALILNIAILPLKKRLNKVSF